MPKRDGDRGRSWSEATWGVQLQSTRMSSWTGGAVFHIGSKEILHNPIMCSSVSLPLRLCPDPRGYPTTHTLLWWGCGRARDVVSQLVKPLQMTAELEVEALRDILRDLVQLCHHLTHDVTTRTHDQKLMVFHFWCPLRQKILKIWVPTFRGHGSP
jgi:hypothetical protein